MIITELLKDDIGKYCLSLAALGAQKPGEHYGSVIGYQTERGFDILGIGRTMNVSTTYIKDPEDHTIKEDKKFALVRISGYAAHAEMAACNEALINLLYYLKERFENNQLNTKESLLSGIDLEALCQEVDQLSQNEHKPLGLDFGVRKKAELNAYPNVSRLMDKEVFAGATLYNDGILVRNGEWIFLVGENPIFTCNSCYPQLDRWGVKVEYEHDLNFAWKPTLMEDALNQLQTYLALDAESKNKIDNCVVSNYDLLSLRSQLLSLEELRCIQVPYRDEDWNICKSMA